MGYYTKFSLEIKTPMTEERAKQIAARLSAIIGYDEDWFELVDSDDRFEDVTLATWELEACDEMKWYDWREDMSQLADEFPDVEFRLEGNGEDKDDWWVALFKGERKQIKYCSPPIDQWED